MPVEFDGAAIGLDQADDHVKYRGLAGAVRTQQTHRFAAADIDADAAHDLPGAETLFHAMHSQVTRPLGQPWRGRAIDLGPRRPRRFRRLAAGAPGIGGDTSWANGDRFAGHRRRIAHRIGQHVAYAIAERGDVRARTRKSWRTRASPGVDGTC